MNLKGSVINNMNSKNYTSCQHGNQNGRLGSKEPCHVQRIEDETTQVDYNSSTSVQTLFIKFEGLKDMLNSIRKEDLNYKNEETMNKQEKKILI